MDLLRVAIVTIAACLVIGCAIANPYNWMGRDRFDEIMDKMNNVNEKNCKFLSMESLRLPADSLGQVPQFTKLPQIVIFRNRTKLIHVHNTALNRGFFYSYILQKLDKSQEDSAQLPGFMYYYLSASADISSSPGMLNGSSILFDTDTHYANFFRSLEFNRTLPLFGPKAWRLDDFNDNVNWLREPTNNTIHVTDMGAGQDRNYTASWHRLYQMFLRDRDRGIDFIPDLTAGESDSNRKHQYDIKIFKAESTGVMSKVPETNDSRKFFGPPSPGIGEDYQPVYFSRPYFDCGRSNIWLVTAVAPVIDFMRRYSPQMNLRRAQYVAVSTADIDFQRIDFDPCARSSSGISTDRTVFSGIARCRPTTQCEPIAGFGFRRGNYMCHCRPGFRYPYWQNGPFMGRDLEQASAAEASKFECIPVGWQLQWLTESGISTGPGKRRKRRSARDTRDLLHLMQLHNATSKLELRQKLLEADRLDREAGAAAKYGGGLLPRVGRRLAATLGGAAESVAAMFRVQQKQLLRKRREISTAADYGDENVFYLGRKSSFDANRYSQVKQLMDWKKSVTAANCRAQLAERLVLPGEAGFGADKQFEVQARSALRLAHFLSSFMQNVNPDEAYGELLGDRYLNRDQLFGEVFANVMADKWILSSGIYFAREGFWDPQQQRKREYFGPTALKLSSLQQTDSGERQTSFVAEDAAGWTGQRAYFNQDWFLVLKERWASNSYGLEQFVVKPYVRSDINGTQVREHQRYPLFFRAPRYEDIYWSKPYFDCKRNEDSSERPLETWVITASAPFFGLSSHKTLQFAGVVSVTIPLSKLDVNMCPASFYQANYFKNSAPCNYESTFCAPIVRNNFELYSDSYKCECRQGYEFPYNESSVWFFAGGTVSGHYDRMLGGQNNYYRLLRCREGSSSTVTATVALALAAVAAALAARRL